MIKNSIVLLSLSCLLAGICSCNRDDDKDNAPDCIDLGLSVKWASFNIGASKPEESGSFYSWGETSDKSVYEWSTYKYFRKAVTLSGQTVPRDSIKVTKYCTDKEKGYGEFTDNITVLEPADDVANICLGGNWRMPTEKEFQELIDSCTWTWTELNGVQGCVVTSNVEGFTDRSIFIPAQFSRTPISEIVTTSTGGHRFEVVDYHNEYSGNYLSSSIEDSLHRPVYLDILDGYFEMKKSGQWPRFNSFYIRPVMPLDPATIQNRVLPQVELIETNYVYDGEIDISEFEGLGEIVDDSLLQ